MGDNYLEESLPDAELGEKFAREVIVALGEGVAIIDAHGRFEYVNPAYAQMVARAPEALIGQSPFDVTHPDDHDALQQARQQCQSGERSTYEARLVQPGGAIVFTQITGVPRREDDEVVGAYTIVTDLTERKQAEEELRRSEHRYQMLSELTSDYAGSFRLEPDGRLTEEWIGGAFTPITGYTPEEVAELGGLIAIIHPDDRAEAQAQMEAMLSGESFVDEFRIITKNGRVRWLRDHVHAEVDPETGRPIRYYTAVQDITVRKEAEQALRQSEARYRSLAESSGVGIWQITAEGYTLYINPAMCSLLGLESPDELSGKTYHEFFTPDSLETIEEHHALRAKGESSSYEAEISGADGQRRHVVVYGTPLRDAEGRLHSLIGSCVDVTEWKQVTQELEAQQQFVQKIFDTNPDVLYVFDLDKQRPVFQNRNVAEAIDYTVEEIREMGDDLLPRLAHPDDLPRIAAHFALLGAAADGETFDLEYRMRHADGSWCWFYSRDTIFKRAADGRVQQIIGTATDITERKRVEEAVRQSEARYRRLFKNALVGVFRSTPDGHFLQANPALVQMLGYGSEEALLALNIAEDVFVDPAQRARLRAEHEPEEVIRGVEATWKRKDGEEIIVKIDGRVMRDESGEISCYEGMVQDITRRKQAEQALISEKAFTDALVDSLPGAFFVFNEDGRFLRWNKNMELVTGYSKEKIASLHPLDFVIEAERTLIARKIEEVLTQGEVEVEAHLLTKDGRAIPYLFTSRRIALDKGPAVIGLGLDITDRKQVEERLRQSEANLRAIFNNTLQAFVLFDTDRRVQAANSVANDWAEQVLGRPLQEGEQADDIFAQFQFDNFAQVFERALKGEAVIQERKIAVGDEAYWFETNHVPVTTEDGAIVGVSISVLNVTERKQAEVALHQSKAELQHIIDTVPEGVLLLGGNGRIRLANPVAEQYLAALAPGWQNGRLTHLGDRPLSALLTSPPKGLWHEVVGDGLVFEAKARPVENGPENAGWVLVLRDVTQEREIQQRVQQQERLAAVGKLAAGIAHDFNNVLAVITLYTQLIARTAELSSRTRERLHTVEQQAQRAADLIQQILDFSRQSVLKRRPLDLLPFMEELVVLLERALPEHIGVGLDHADEEYIIAADPSRMQQVMMNLAVNARDAMPDGGRLRIRLAHVGTEETKSLPVRDMPPGDWVQIQVADTGGGIPSEKLAHIFEPFFTTKDVGQGSGLGLAQVYGIVQQHEGYIAVTTALGKGTTFSLYFPPLASGGGDVVTSSNASLHKGKGQTVLVVEDDPATRAALVDSLILLNYAVIEAENGRQALSILGERGEEIDVVLSDVIMPKMGGKALFQAMRRQDLAVPVVFVTGYLPSKEIERLQALGMAGWLSKPPDLVELSHLLARILTPSAK